MMESNPPDNFSCMLFAQTMALNCLIQALVRQADPKRLIQDFEVEAETARTMLVPSELPESIYQSFEQHYAEILKRLNAGIAPPGG